MTTSDDAAIRPAHFDLSLPVLMKEMRSRMRGVRAPVLLFITTGLAILVGLIIIMPQWDNISYTNRVSEHYSGSTTMADVGKGLFFGLIILQSILCALIAPALTAGAISIEREQQTLDLLFLTRLSNANIIMGKLLSSLGFLLIILVCALPVAAISFLLGGVDPWQLGWSLLTIVSTVSLFGAIALYCSARYTKTATSVAIAYCLCVVFMAIVPIFIALFMLMHQSLTSHYYSEIPYLVFLGASAAVLALIPAAVVSILTTMITRHTNARIFNIILWMVFAGAGLIALLLFADPLYTAIQHNAQLFFLGNPVTAMFAALDPNAFFSGGGTSSLLERGYVPITAGILFCCAFLIVAQTVHELRKLRHKTK